MPNRSDPTKKLKLGDYVEVLVPLGKDEDGNTTYEKGVVSRAGLSDEKWADVKARAEASGRLSTIKDSEKTRGGSSDVEGDAIRFKDKSGGSVVVPRGDLDGAAWSKRISDAADKDSFESATQDGEVVSAGPSRAKKVGTDNLADEGASPTTATPVGGDGTAQARGGGAGVTLSVDEGLDTEKPSRKDRPVGTDMRGQSLSVDEPQASGPRKFFGDAVKGALPGPPGMGTPPGAIPPGQGSLLEAVPRGADLATSEGTARAVGGLPEPLGQEVPAPVPAPDFATAAGTSQALGGGYAAGPFDAVRKAGANVLGPSPGAQMADLQGRSATMQPPLAAPTPAPAPVDPTSMKVGMKASSTTGSGTQPGGIPSLQGAEDAFMKSQAVAAETEAAGAREKLKERAKYESDVKAFEADQKASVMRQRESEDRINNAYLTTLDEMGKKAQIDPDHFWSSKSVGQKAFMAIGGFLAGLGGRDPSGRLDQMINQDIAVQRENFQMAQEQGKAKMAGLNTLYGRLRDRGLDDREAAAAARASMNQGLINRLEMVSEQMKPGEAQAKAQMAIANFRMNKVKAEDDLKNSASERWARGESLNMKKRSMEIEAQDKAAKASKPKAMQATLSKEMAGLRDELASVRLMRDASGGGFFERAKVDAATTLPGGGLGAAAPYRARGQSYQTQRAGILKAALGALTNADYETAKAMLPEKITAMEDPGPYFDQFEQFIAQKIARREEQYGNAGPDIRGESAGGQGGE